MYLQYSIAVAAEQSFRYTEPTNAKFWISKNASLCWVLANQVTFCYILCLKEFYKNYLCESTKSATYIVFYALSFSPLCLPSICIVRNIGGVKQWQISLKITLTIGDLAYPGNEETLTKHDGE